MSSMPACSAAVGLEHIRLTQTKPARRDLVDGVKGVEGA